MYGLPNDFPNQLKARQEKNPFEKVRILEDAMKSDIDDNRFIPYIQLHEYEALLFSDVATTDKHLSILLGVNRTTQLKNIVQVFESPEHINEGADTAPSKRLKSIYQTYDKILFGNIAVAQIGLQKIREECRHFNDWLTALESL